MGRYHYSHQEKQMNKVLKSHQEDLDYIEKRIDLMSVSTEERISESENLLRSLGYSLESAKLEYMPNRGNKVAIPTMDSWEDMVRDSEARYSNDVELEDLLSAEEFQNAYKDLDNINRQFYKSTSLVGIDMSLVVVAAALQTIRWVLMPEIGRTMDKAKRISDKDGDELVKKLKSEFVKKHKDWSSHKHSQGNRLRKAEGKTWKEIIFGGVPYDTIKGTKDVLATGLSGKTHRYKTLGHDPILGWLFGTANILTDTMTLNNLCSYRVYNNRCTDEVLLIPQLIRSSQELTWKFCQWLIGIELSNNSDVPL